MSERRTYGSGSVVDQVLESDIAKDGRESHKGPRMQSSKSAKSSCTMCRVRFVPPFKAESVVAFLGLRSAETTRLVKEVSSCRTSSRPMLRLALQTKTGISYMQLLGRKRNCAHPVTSQAIVKFVGGGRRSGGTYRSRFVEEVVEPNLSLAGSALAVFGAYECRRCRSHRLE